MCNIYTIGGVIAVVTMTYRYALKWMKRVSFGVISNLFPKAPECETGIKTFYFQVKEKVKENFGVILDNDLWIPFAWDSVYTLTNADRESQNAEKVASEESQPFSGNIPLSI